MTNKKNQENKEYLFLYLRSIVFVLSLFLVEHCVRKNKFMKKILLLLLLIAFCGFSQTKSTPVVSFNADMKAQFTLNNETSKLILVLTGTADKWSSVGLGTSTSISSTNSGDIYTYITSVTDNATPEPNQDWATVSNTVESGKRTLTLERKLTTSDLNDLQMEFSTTNAVDIVWSRSGTALATAPNPNRGTTTATFTTLGIDEVTLNNEAIVYPNPSSGEVYIKTQNNLSKVNVYNQTGTLIKSINIKDKSNEIKLNVYDLPKALYFFELRNETEKTWKKVIVN